MTGNNSLSTSSVAGLTLAFFTVGSLSTLSEVDSSKMMVIPYQHENNQSSSETGDFSEPDCWKYDTSSQKLFFAPLIYQTEEAKRFIEGSNEAGFVLASLVEKLTTYFGAKPLMLELVHDPESGEDGLLLSVMVKNDIESACETLQRFENEWWLDRMSDADGVFSVDVMPV